MAKTELTEHATELLEALRALGEGWHGRADLSRQIGKRRLNGFDADMLQRLLDAGLIEATHKRVKGRNVNRWEYRIVKER